MHVGGVRGRPLPAHQIERSGLPATGRRGLTAASQTGQLNCEEEHRGRGSSLLCCRSTFFFFYQRRSPKLIKNMSLFCSDFNTTEVVSPVASYFSGLKKKKMPFKFLKCTVQSEKGKNFLSGTWTIISGSQRVVIMRPKLQHPAFPTFKPVFLIITSSQTEIKFLTTTKKIPLSSSKQ